MSICNWGEHDLRKTALPSEGRGMSTPVRSEGLPSDRVVSHQRWPNLTPCDSPSSLFVTRWTGGGPWTQGEPSHRLPSDLWPEQNEEVGDNQKLRETENRWWTPVSNASDLSEGTDIRPWMPPRVQSLRTKFRGSLSNTSDLRTWSCRSAAKFAFSEMQLPSLPSVPCFFLHLGDACFFLILVSGD